MLQARVPHLALASLLCLPAAFARSTAPQPAAPEAAPRSPDGVPLRLVLALDGIPYDLFAELQAHGHFAGFRPAARMVSTFPSLTDVSFAAIGGSEPPEGYQVMRFDRDTNRVVGNTLASLSSRLHPFLPSDSRERSGFHRAIGYVFSYRVALEELHGVGRDFMASDKETFVGYVETCDAMLHVHGRRDALRFLLRVDAFLADLGEQVRARTGRELAVDIVSDHGSTLRRGRPARLEPTLAACGFCREKRLEDPSDVAYSLAGIIGSVAISCAPGRSAEVAACLAADPAVDFVAFSRGDAVAVLSANAEAEVRSVGGAAESYSYRTLRGDPLQIGPAVGIAESAPRPAEGSASEDELLPATADAPYPDALRRVWRAFHGAVKEPSDVLVSLRDGYEAGNGGVRFAARLRGRAGTHGSLTRAASLGVVASNWRDVRDTDSWGANDVLFGEPTLAAVHQRRSSATAVAALAQQPAARHPWRPGAGHARQNENDALNVMVRAGRR